MQASASPLRGLTTTQWLICVIASIGFAFDIYELLMLPLIVGPALQELLGAAPGSPEFQQWVGRLFYIPAFAGGIFGLLGGYLTDRLGRRRVLTWSIMIYAFSAFAAGFSTSVWMLLFFRCLVFIGVCVEFVAAVAWLAELFPEPERRERILGYTQAFSSIGGLLVAFANGLCVKYAASLPGVDLFGWFGDAIKDHHAAWRYTLMSGLIPALPLAIIRPFLPESPAWQRKKAAGTLKRPSLAALFAPDLRRTTVVTTLMFAMSYGAAFGAIQHMPRILPATPEVKAAARVAAAAASEGQPAADAARLGRQATAQVHQAAAAKATKVQELGGLYGRALVAVLLVGVLGAGRISRRSVLGWSVLVAVLMLEVLANFAGSFGERLWRLVQGAGIGLVGGFLVWAALLGLQRLLPRQTRSVLRMLQVPGLVLMPLVFAYAALESLTLLYVGMFLAGMVTVGQFSFWGNYLPRVYPVHLRGTGESFAANIGGRLLGTSFAWVTTTLATTADPAYAPVKLAYMAALVGLAVYAVGFVLSFALPEPQEASLSD
ncbi:MAG: MFS transporter [Verrucomicrobia bacterium]|nr:MFS transporter [Verrucomicrobiota bacterium]